MSGGQASKAGLADQASSATRLNGRLSTGAKRALTLETPPANQTWKVYYYAGAQLIAMRVMTSTASTLYFLHSDHLGSTSLTTDASGNVLARQSYYPYGSVRAAQGQLPTDITFTGQRADATGLMYFRARYYDSWGGQPSTSAHLHQEEWLDLNTMQSSHGGGHDVAVWEWIARDYGLTPPKPTLDAEPNYEDHPVNPWPSWDPALGYFRDDDVRRQAYRSVFAGGCGVTYGHHSVWSFHSPRQEPVNHPCMYWPEALDRPGASQLIHLRRLMESRPYFSRIPDQALIASDVGTGARHLQATRDSNGRYAFVYFPDAVRTATIDLAPLSAGQVTAWWYDTHTGEAYPAGAFAAAESREFTTPVEWHDWVLVLDDAAAGFGAPGRAV